MNKALLNYEIARLTNELDEARAEMRLAWTEKAKLAREVADMRKHWRPVPMAHEWQPLNSQCALCDEPKDALRHQVDTL